MSVSHQPHGRTVRIGINALAVSRERPGGDVSYVLEMVRRLPAHGPHAEWVIFIAASARPLFGELPRNARYAVLPVPRGSTIVRAVWEQTALVPRAARERLDVLFAPVNVLPVAYPGTTVLTTHEAEPFMPASLIPLPLLAWWRVMRTLSARRAERILTVSEAARQDLVRWAGIRRNRIHVVHLGVDLARFSVTQKVGPSPLDGPYVLWVGRPYPRKNLNSLLDAFAGLQRLGRPERLVLIGPPGWNEVALNQRIASEFTPGKVLRLSAMWSELPSWYAHASIFAFPSSQETFGLPVLEAMACGSPVVAGDIPALREVGGAAARYVLPNDSHQLLKAVRELLSDPELAEGLRATGLAHAATFDWERTARETYQHLSIVAGSVPG